MNHAIMVFMAIRSISYPRLFLIRGVLSLFAAAAVCSCAISRANVSEEPNSTLSGTSASRVRTTTARTVTVIASPTSVNQGGTAVYTVTISRVNSSSSTSVIYSMTGTATLGKSYTLNTGTTGKAVIKAGASSAKVTLTALTTNASTGVVATMNLSAGSGYTVGSPSSASVTVNGASPAPTPTPSPTPTATPSPTATPTPSPSPTPVPTPVPTATPSSSPTQNVWISVRTDGLSGSGAQADPYDGSTPDKFDALMSSLQWVPNPGIHLVGTGPFRTYATHSWFVRSGWTVSGDGMYSTTVQIIGNVAGIRHEVDCFASPSNVSTDNVIIRDLTIDCNWPGLSATADTGTAGEKNIKIMAINLFGSNNTITGARCINSYGSMANGQEQFAIRLAASAISDATGNVIDSCRVESPSGNYGSPFALHGWIGDTFNPVPHLITNSKVVSCVAVGVNNGLVTGFTTGGVTLTNMKDCQIDGNTFTDCYGAAYIDTGSVDGLQVTNNTVVRGWFGVGLVSSTLPKQNITISGNNFLIQDRLVGGASYGIIAGYGVTTNLTINNNTISFDTSGGGLSSFWGVAASLLTTATVSNNTIGTAYYPVNNAATGTGVTLSNNLQANGSPAPGL
jgi:hypothetical protein